MLNLHHVVVGVLGDVLGVLGDVSGVLSDVVYISSSHSFAQKSAENKLNACASNLTMLEFDGKKLWASSSVHHLILVLLPTLMIHWPRGCSVVVAVAEEDV